MYLNTIYDILIAMKTKILLIFLLIFSCNITFLKAQEENPLYISTMQNGLSVFTKEDFSSALVHVSFVCRKAGYSAQTQYNAGFFPLYVQLFKYIAEQKGYNIFKTIELNAECKANSAVFYADVPYELLKDFLNALYQSLVTVELEDSIIEKVYNDFKMQVMEYSKSTTGFINAAIDSRVFSEAPWTIESGVYAPLFANMTAAQVRAIITDIARLYYIPTNCAIFASGPISKERFYNMAEQAFSLWQSNSQNIENTVSNNIEEKLETGDEVQKKFVLTDSAFSSDLTQLVVQYTNFSVEQNAILSAMFNLAQDSLVKNELKDDIVALRSADYMSVQSANYGKKSRLIFQALLEKPYSFTKDESFIKPDISPSPIAQSEAFVKHIKEYSFLENNFAMAKNAVKASFRKQTAYSAIEMDSIADFWALTLNTDSANCYRLFLDMENTIQDIEMEQTSNSLYEQEPFVFLLVNDSVYEQYKEDFEQAGYERVTRQNASWYHNQAESIVENVAKEENSLIKQIESDSTLTADQIFYRMNMANIEESSLKNGIPITYYTRKDSQTVFISVCIKGGELSSPVDEHLLRTVIINYLARNTQQELAKLYDKMSRSVNIKAWTEETVSYITMECLYEDTASVLQALSQALIYGEIKAVTADRLVREQKGSWNTMLSDPSVQLKYNALNYLYKDTSFARYYNQESLPLKNTDLHSMSLAYMQLLDASLYSVVIVGNIEKVQSLQEKLEQSLGVLKSLTSRIKQDFPSPTFINKTRRVQLHHIYSTTKTPEMAPSGIPLLVPTKEFLDPAQYYFTAPSSCTELAIYNALLYELANRINDIAMAEHEELDCKAFTASLSMPIGIIQAGQVRRLQIFSNAYKKALKSLIQDIEENQAEGQDNKSIEYIKALWQQNELKKTNTNEGIAILLQYSINESNNPLLYLDMYTALSSSTKADFENVLKKYFPETPPFVVTSVDSK